MTTNIFDGHARVMATDSRWSIEYGCWLIYLDDTGYEKIERRNGFALMFAGAGGVIQAHKNWIRSAPSNFSNMPGTKGMSVCMVEEKSGEVVFQKHQDIEADNVFCAGTGARPAYNCWSTNKCSKKAVESAKAKDNYSGGDVKYIDFAASKTNLVDYNASALLDIATVSANIWKRGIAMKIHSTPTVSPELPFVKAQSLEEEEKEVRSQIGQLVANGTLTATAPCDGMHSDWSNEDNAKYKQAMARMFGWK